MSYLQTTFKASLAAVVLATLPAFSLVAQEAVAEARAATRAIEANALTERGRMPPNLTASQMARGMPRVIGGEPANVAGQWEFTVNIKLADGGQCGGTLISPNIDMYQGNSYVRSWLHNSNKNLWVLTAAHCMLNDDRSTANASLLRIKAGIQDLQGLVAPVVLQGEEVFVHPDYIQGAYTLGNDIALIKISEPDIPGGAGNVGTVANPRSIQLPTDFNASLIYRPGTRQVVNGWGRYGSENGPVSAVLQTADIPYLNQQQCYAQYETINGEIARGAYCAGWLQGGIDSCAGDSGGPLFYPGSQSGLISNQPVLAGIVSWGKGCARSGYPGIYTNVYFFKDWIENVVTRG